jgi:hypothetical protein
MPVKLRLMMVRDTAFEPRPHRYAKRCAPGVILTGQAPLQIGSTKSSLERLLRAVGVGFETTRLALFQDHRSSIRRSRDAASFVLGEAITKINGRADVKIAVAPS